MLRHVALLCFATACLFGTAAHATKVNGKIVVTAKFREALGEQETKARDPKTSGYWNEPNGLMQVEPPVVDPARDLAVIINKEGAPAPAADDVTTVDVRAGSLQKNAVVVRPGTRVKFINVDPFDHSLYSPAMATFPPEQQSRKAFRPIDFKSEGVFQIKCKLLTHFEGWIVVTPATYVMEVKPSGEFSLEEAEPGKYTVKVFHDGKWVHEQTFEVKEKEKELEVEVKLDAPQDEKKKGDEKAEQAADQAQPKDKSGAN